MRSLHDARKLVPEKVPGPNNGEETPYFAVYDGFAHLGPYTHVGNAEDAEETKDVANGGPGTVWDRCEKIKVFLLAGL